MNPNHKYYLEKGLRSDKLELIVAGVDSDLKMDSKVINDTTIVATYNPERLGSDKVSCKINVGPDEKRGICYQNIFVGGMRFWF